GGLCWVLVRLGGCILTYVSYGHLRYGFGWLGTTAATFRVRVAWDGRGETIWVVDRGANRVVVFEPTVYAQLIHAAIREYQGGHYDRSAELWGEVLRLNLNYDLAYTGIGSALLRQDRFAEAMANFRLGNNREQYSKAFSLYRREVMADRKSTRLNSSH